MRRGVTKADSFLVKQSFVAKPSYSTLASGAGLSDLDQRVLKGDLTHKLGSLFFNPQSRLRRFWDGLLLISIAVDCIVSPFLAAFPSSKGVLVGWTLAGLVFDGLYWVDMAAQFYTVAYDMRYGMLRDQKEIRKQYLQNRFSIDMISCIPLELFVKGTRHFLYAAAAGEISAAGVGGEQCTRWQGRGCRSLLVGEFQPASSLCCCGAVAWCAFIAFNAS